MYGGGQRLMLGVSLHHCTPYSFRQGLIEPGALWLARLAGSVFSDICLALPLPVKC